MTKHDKSDIKAFIAAPAQANLINLKEELGRRGVSFFTAYDLAPTTNSLTANIQQAIKRADLVIAVIPEQASPNIFFELGIAQALNKSLILLVSPKYGNIPSDLVGAFYVRTDPQNTETIGFALDQSLNRLKRPARRSEKLQKEGQPLGKKANKFLAQIRNESENLSGQAFQSLVAEVLQAAGVNAVSQSSQNDTGIDIAVWSDALQPDAGNPLLIEVKSSIRNNEQLLQAINQVEQYRVKSGSKLAMLIVNTTLTALSAAPFMGGVLAITFVDLVDHLRTKTFAETVRELRNQYVHSGRK